MKQWYAVYCRPRQEGRADEHLRRQGFEVFFPRMTCLRQRASGLQPVTEPLFPRYLFVRLDESTDQWGAIRSTRGVVDLVRVGYSLLPVPEGIVACIRRRIDPETGSVDLRKESDFQPGEKLQIIRGPFRGCEAIFETRDGNRRVVVLLDLMQREQSVTVETAAVMRA